MDPSEQLLAAVEAHLNASGETPTAFGLRVLKDPRFVFQLRGGRQPRRDVREKVLKALQPAPSRRKAA